MARIAEKQATLQELQAYQAALEQTVSSLQEQAQTLEQSWATVAEQIQALESRRQQIFTGEAPSVAATGEALAATLERLASVEEEVLGLLDSAISSYTNARTRGSAAV